MTAYDTVDIFADKALAQSPHPYFEYLRSLGPITPLPMPNVMAVTGYEEGLAIFRDEEHFSSINTSTGPFLGLELQDGVDVAEQITAFRQANPFLATIISQDMPDHDRSKAILSGIITPARLKENEVFMRALADRIIDEFIGRGSFEVATDYGQPFAQLVIADLLGVPEEDHPFYRAQIGKLPGTIGEEPDMATNPLARIGAHFYGYIQDRRTNPRSDVLTRLAQQRLDDGSLPEVAEVVGVSTFLFGAGQDTTVQLFSAMMRFLGDDPALQARLRANRKLIPEFVEETLRLEGTVKATFRYCKAPVTIGGVDISPGTHVMLMLAAMNRDPRRFEKPGQPDIDRSNVRTHVAFGRGLHACAGGPLARSEAVITLNHLFDRTRDLRISEAHHGLIGARRFEFAPNFLLRGVKEVHVEFDRA